MKQQRIKNTNKGITLIALIITIIVMLILVAVTISMVVNGGLFDYAGKAARETKNAISDEQKLANGAIQVDGVWYDSIEDFINGKPSGSREIKISYDYNKTEGIESTVVKLKFEIEGIPTREEYYEEYFKDKTTEEIEALVIKGAYGGSFDDLLAEDGMTRKQLEEMAEEEGLTYEEYLKAECMWFYIEYISEIAGYQNKTETELEQLFVQLSGYEGSFDDLLDEDGITREQVEQMAEEEIGLTYKEYLMLMLVESVNGLVVTVEVSDGQTIQINYLEEQQAEIIITSNGKYTITATGMNGERGAVELEISNLKENFSEIYTQTSSYTDKNGDTAVIPKGYAVGTADGINTIKNGLVIKDENGNEFVWIPVEKAIVTESEIEETKKILKKELEDEIGYNNVTYSHLIDINDLSAVQRIVNSGEYPMAVQVGEDYKGILYNFSGTDTLTLTVKDWTNVSSNREPANLTDSYTWYQETNVNGTTVAAGTSYVYDSQDMFTLYGVGTYTDTLYQESFNSMVESVAENGGFYVGRYEMSLYTDTEDSGVQYAQSKKNRTALEDTEWYKMYKYERDYAKYNTNLGVTSEMIWGSQWDQMMIFVNGKYDGATTPAKFYVTTSGGRHSGDSSIKTGMNTVDQVANIFDLEASRAEWTQEALSSNNRVTRGNYCYSFGNASMRYFIYNPTTCVNIGMSSRAALYVK